MADVAPGAVASLPCVAPYWISLRCCRIATTTNKYPQHWPAATMPVGRKLQTVAGYWLTGILNTVPSDPAGFSAS
jgi:hypothetical protein